MTLDYITLGPVPCDEDCAQVGSPDYAIKARKECRAFINQIRRQHPALVDKIANLNIKSFPHDFGTYYEVVALFDDNSPDETHAAYELENVTPTVWDREARIELGLYPTDLKLPWSHEAANVYTNDSLFCLKVDSKASPQESADLAAFISKAANHHHELVEMLHQTRLTLLRFKPDMPLGEFNQLIRDSEKLLEKVRA